MSIINTWLTVKQYLTLTPIELEITLNKEADSFATSVLAKPMFNVDTQETFNPGISKIKSTIDEQILRNKKELESDLLTPELKKLGEIHTSMLEKFSSKLNNVS